MLGLQQKNNSTGAKNKLLPTLQDQRNHHNNNARDNASESGGGSVTTEEVNRIYAQAEYNNNFLLNSIPAGKAYTEYLAMKSMVLRQREAEDKILYQQLKNKVVEAYVEWVKLEEAA